MSILDNNLTKIGKKLETTKMLKGSFPYKFNVSVINLLIYTTLYAFFGGGLAYMTFVSNNISLFADVLGENKQYSFYLQILVLLIFTAVYLANVLAHIKISCEEIVFPKLYNFLKRKITIHHIEKISFSETRTVPRGISLLADIFPRVFSSIEASLYANSITLN